MAKYAMWVPGYVAIAEDDGLVSQRRGWGVGYNLPNQPGRELWFHFPIPTPVVMQERRTNLVAAWVMFNTGARTEIRRIHVWDGPIRVYQDDIARYGDHSRDLDAVNHINVSRAGFRFGLGLSVAVKILSPDPDGPVQVPQIYFSTAGGDFDA
jgi:hypothetical protein